MEVQVREAAQRAIAELLASEPRRELALVVRPPDPQECCRLGFDVAAVPVEEVPAEAYELVGEHGGCALYVHSALIPDEPRRLVINVDRASRSLAAVLLPG